VRRALGLIGSGTSIIRK